MSADLGLGDAALLALLGNLPVTAVEVDIQLFASDVGNEAGQIEPVEDSQTLLFANGDHRNFVRRAGLAQYLRQSFSQWIQDLRGNGGVALDIAFLLAT